MFLKECFHKGDATKIVRVILAAVGVKGLKLKDDLSRF